MEIRAPLKLSTLENNACMFVCMTLFSATVAAECLGVKEREFRPRRNELIKRGGCSFLAFFCFAGIVLGVDVI